MSAPTNVPQSIGRYSVIREIGRSNAVVYEAYDPNFGRRVAIKVISPDPNTDAAEVMERFRRELHATARVAHPNVMQVYDAATECGSMYLVMELLTGSSLAGAIQSRGSIPLPEAKAILGQVLSAVGSAHSRFVIHRDIKPANIQLCDDGSAKLLDFGIARLVNEPVSDLTVGVVGTPAYFSPEQCFRPDVDKRSDLFSLGLVAYEMLVGRRAFEGATIDELLEAIRREEPYYPHSMATDLRAWLQTALNKDPALRFQSAAEMDAAFQSLASPAVAPAPPQTPAAANPKGQIFLPGQNPAHAGANPPPYGNAAGPARPGKGPTISARQVLRDVAAFWHLVLAQGIVAATFPQARPVLALLDTTVGILWLAWPTGSRRASAPSALFLGLAVLIMPVSRFAVSYASPPAIAPPIVPKPEIAALPDKEIAVSKTRARRQASRTVAPIRAASNRPVPSRHVQPPRSAKRAAALPSPHGEPGSQTVRRRAARRSDVDADDGAPVTGDVPTRAPRRTDVDE